MTKAHSEVKSSSAICLAATDEPVVCFKALSGSPVYVYARTEGDGYPVLDIIRVNRASRAIEWVQTCVQPELHV